MIERSLAKYASSAGALALVGAGLIAAAAPQPARASSWGCQVVLCLATPGSPTTYPQCVPPITRLWRVLAMGGSFPTCSEGGVNTHMSRISKHHYLLRTVTPDGTVKIYDLDTRHSAITQYEMPAHRGRSGLFGGTMP